MQYNTLLSEYTRLTIHQKTALKKLGINTIIDLLYHFPVRYGDTSEITNISSLEKGKSAVIFGKINNLKINKGFKTKITMADAWVEDESGKIHCVWFNQPYLAKMTPENALVRIEGKISERKKDNELYFSNPKIEIVNKIPIGVGESLFGKENIEHNLYPIYPESKGITSNWIYYKIIDLFKSDLFKNFKDPIPKYILEKYNLPEIKTAFIWMHTPLKADDAKSARKRFAFQEVFLIQLQKQLTRKEYEKNPSFIIETRVNEINEFIKRFPFEATEAQKNSIETIINDFKKNHAMSRLLEGDVGSGKTAVAASTAYAIVTTKPKNRKHGNLQVAYMCPTEILAIQHFESFIKYFSYLGIQIGLITGSGCRKFPSKINPKGWTDISKNQLLKWVENGEIPILIGTHALIQKNVKFKNLAYVIIDEQHRFGLKQRSSLVQKELMGLVMNEIGQSEKKTIRDNFSQRDGTGEAIRQQANMRVGENRASSQISSSSPQFLRRVPHLLSMTATPIPRTLALTIYGDLDLTLLDQMPHGRKPIITEIVMPNERESIYKKINIELEAGRQAYIICPRIDEPDPDKEERIITKSVKEEAKRLKEKVFTKYEIGILHSKMKPNEKDKIMLDFKAGKIHILVATSVVEVGVSVENATVIIIEGAERFGLAQLHQLRGRVIRSNHQAYCYVFADTKSQKTIDRLKALKTAKNGFELAEYDLMFRGAGQLYTGKQWGVSDIAMDALKNIKMVEFAREEAKTIIEEDPSLNNYPALLDNLKQKHLPQMFSH